MRVIVNTIDECYEVFGKIHKCWKPIPGRIKDYIATPKPNMYQSLHTTVVTNFGQPFEIQIRTFEMHRTAEFGIAAHWKYKEKKGEDTAFTERLSWIREVLDWEGGLKDSTDFMKSLKTELYSTELLVFTPKGKVISLPRDATPIDFAYAIHSEIGNHCVGARVNAKMVPLNSTLETGDVVEILTSANSKGPSWDWLKIVRSSSARAKIKQFFKREMKDENIKLGKSMLEAEAKHRGYVLSEILTEESFAKLSERFSFFSQDEMFASVGYGAITVNQILYKLIDFYKKEVPKSHCQQEFGKTRFERRDRQGHERAFDALCGLLHARAGRRDRGLRIARPRRRGAPRGLPQPEKPGNGRGAHSARRMDCGKFRKVRRQYRHYGKGSGRGALRSHRRRQRSAPRHHQRKFAFR